MTLCSHRSKCSKSHLSYLVDIHCRVRITGGNMATLEILEIRGIRSFGPVESQKITFINPVTLIHGPNGTGKTVSI